MKTVMSGIALAAILAFAIPIGANAAEGQQAPMQGQKAATSHINKGDATKKMHARHISHKAHGHVAMGHRADHHYAARTSSRHRTTIARTGGTSPTDNVANQLNRGENQRLSGSSTPTMTGPNMAPEAGNPNMTPSAGGANMSPMGGPNQSMQGR